MTYLVVAVVGLSLVAGAVWGLAAPPPDGVEGFIVALAGGALLVSATLELIEPSTKSASVGPWTTGGEAERSQRRKRLDWLRWSVSIGGIPP